MEAQLFDFGAPALRTDVTMEPVEFTATIRMAPHGKGRPKAVSIGGHARVYTPRASAEWEHFAAAELREAFATWTGGAFDGALGLEIVAIFERPGELLKTVKRTGRHKYSTFRIPYAQKPDADNLAKSVCDAIEKAGLFSDDKTIALLTVGKHYAMIGELPHVEVRLWRLA